MSQILKEKFYEQQQNKIPKAKIKYKFVDTIANDIVFLVHSF